MKIAELVKVLNDLYFQHGDADIILQKDAEGNGYSPLAGADVGYYVPDSSWSGNFYDSEWTADDCDMDEQEFNEMRSKPISVVLFPVN